MALAQDARKLDGLDTQIKHQKELWELIQGFLVTGVVRSAVELGILDCIKEGVDNMSSIALRTQTNEEAVGRVLRALQTIELVDTDEFGGYKITEKGDLLTESNSDSMRDLLLSFTSVNWPLFEQYQSVIKTNKSNFQECYGSDFWSYLKQHAHIGRQFDRSMRSLYAAEINYVLDNFDFKPYKRVVDLAGGAGDFSISFLERHPKKTAVLTDFPDVLEFAQSKIKDLDILVRLYLEPGNLLESVSARGDLYISRNILHGMNDSLAKTVLDNYQAALEPKQPLILVEGVIPDEGAKPQAWMDLAMLAAVSGKERTEQEFLALFNQSCLEVDRIESLQHDKRMFVLSKKA